MLRLGIDPGKLYRATFICQGGLCCCNMALISFRLFRKNLGNLKDFFGQMVYRPLPGEKNSRTPMSLTHTVAESVTDSVFFPHSKYHEISQKDGKQVNIHKKAFFSFLNDNLNNCLILRKASFFVLISYF